MAAIDEPAAEAAFAFGMLVEMHARGVLEEARGELVLGLLDGLAVDMVDLLADLVVAPALGRAGERIVVAPEVERWQSGAEARRVDRHARRRLRRRIRAPRRLTPGCDAASV